MVKVLGLLLAILGVIAGAAAAGYRHGWLARDADWSQAKQGQAEADLKAQRKTEAVAVAVAVQVDAKLRTIHDNARTIHDSVPIYVPAAADAHCDVPVGAVELLNAAAEARPPRPPGVAAETPSGTALHTVVDIETGNLGTCQEWRAQLNGWIDWYETSRAALGLPALSDSANAGTP